MIRALWKGKYTSCDFCRLKKQWYYIPLIKLNIYLFTHFKYLKFAVLKVYSLKAFKLKKKYFGFRIGVFFLNREWNVYHKIKKTKKQKEQEQRMKKKNKPIKIKRKGDILIAKKKKKKKKSKVHIKVLKTLRQRFK